jgi:hypothetical protein
MRQRSAEREAHEFNTMIELAKGVAKLICIIKVKAGEDGKMFGSVTAGVIADELKHQFDISLDKRKIHLEHPIRALGDHEVELHLHAEVKGTLKVRVESTTPIRFERIQNDLAQAAGIPRLEWGHRNTHSQPPLVLTKESDKSRLDGITPAYYHGPPGLTQKRRALPLELY